MEGGRQNKERTQRGNLQRSSYVAGGTVVSGDGSWGKQQDRKLSYRPQMLGGKRINCESIDLHSREEEVTRKRQQQEQKSKQQYRELL